MQASRCARNADPPRSPNASSSLRHAPQRKNSPDVGGAHPSNSPQRGPPAGLPSTLMMAEWRPARLGRRPETPGVRTCPARRASSQECGTGAISRTRRATRRTSYDPRRDHAGGLDAISGTLPLGSVGYESGATSGASA